MNGRAFITPHFVAAAVLLLVGASGLNAALRYMNIHLQKLPIEPRLPFQTLPTESESWRRAGADPPPLSAEVLEELGTSNYMSRRYVQKEGLDDAPPQVIDLHCAYYTGMIDTVPHVPERCFVGGGMTIDGSAGVVEPLTLDLARFPVDPTIEQNEQTGVIRRGRTGSYSDEPGRRVRLPADIEENLRLNITRFTNERGEIYHSGYFFIANGGVVPRAENIRLLAFRHEDRYAYYAKVQFTSSAVETPQELAALAAQFLNEMFPEIMLRTPDWTDVQAKTAESEEEQST